MIIIKYWCIVLRHISKYISLVFIQKSKTHAKLSRIFSQEESGGYIRIKTVDRGVVRTPTFKEQAYLTGAE